MESTIEGVVEVEHIVAEQILEKGKHAGGEIPSKIQMPGGYKHVLCHLVFFLLGVCHFLPVTFFSAANNFWMYKFRNTSLETGWNEAANRVYLQTNFPSATLVASSVSSLALGIFNVVYGGRLRIMSRVIVTLLINFIVFIILTASVKINTDNWQLMFFILVLLCYMSISGSIAVNIVSTMSLFPRFPSKYMKTCLIGEGASGIVGDFLNIMTVWIFNGDIIKSTWLYFIAGTLVVGLASFLNIWIDKMTFFKECIASIPINEETKLPSKQEVFRILKSLKFVIWLLFFFLIGMSAAFPGIAALVVSEQDGTGSLWAKSYFSPVMTYLLADFGMLLGRVISYIPWRMPQKAFMMFTIIKTLVFVPMIWLCNAQPRDHLPVVFDRDWEYGLILLTFMTTNGYVINKATMFILEIVDNKDADVAFTLFGLTMNIMQTVSSPIGLFIVNIL